jgi:HEAT repeats
MKQVVLSVIALGVSIAAFVISWLGRGDADTSARAAASRLSAGLADIEARVGALEGRVEIAEAAASSRSAGAGVTLAPRRFDPDVHERGELTERVARLEEKLTSLADGAALRPQPRPESAGPATDAAVLKAIAAWTDTARNPSASEKDRLVALRGLRGKQLEDGTDARLGVVADMVRLAESSGDERVRADVWRQLSHVTDRSMLAPLLSALQNDASFEVRSEAAETLADFLPDEQVRRALQHAAENDPNNKVRSEARDALSARRR